MTLLITSLLIYFSGAFVIPTSSRPRRSFRCIGTELHAKNTNKNKKRRGGPRGAGRRGKPQKDGGAEIDADENVKPVVLKPSSIRKQIIELDRGRPGQSPPLRVCTAEIDDVAWWENPDNENPFGAKLWPSALAISEFLVGLGNLEGYDILELGCGAGLVSIVAAESGARVVASDISPTVIKLCKIGWVETQKQREKQSQRKRQRQKKAEDNDVDVDDKNEIKPGTLDTIKLDLFSESPLPMSNASSTNQKVVIATAMLYESSVAGVLARRAIEACARGAWVMIGDDDTGEREGGRKYFVSELDKLEKEKGFTFRRTWTSSVVKSKPLQWSEKQVKILHLNAPEDPFLDASTA